MSASRGAAVGHKRGPVTAPSYASRGGACAVLTTSTGTRRNHEATPPRNTSGRSASSTSPVVVNGCELFPGVPDLSRLTLEQKLEIIQRLMKGENISVAGLDQSSKKAPAVKTVKNLSAVIECSEIRGQAGDRFVETLEVLAEAKQAQEGEDQTLVEKTGVEEEYEPEICKLVDDLIIVHDEYKTLMERAIEAVVEKNFAETFPEGRSLSLFNEIDEFMETLEAFSKQSPAENMKLFFPSDSTSSEKKTVHCPAEQQEDLLRTVYELSGIMAKLDKHMKGDGWKNMESEVDDKMHLFRKTVDKMERDLKDVEKRKKSIVEGYSLLSTFANPNASGSSGDMFNLEFLKD